MGLLMTHVMGGELFTSNAAFLPVASLEGRLPLGRLLRSWAITYAFNALGAAAMVGLIYAADFANPEVMAFPIALAQSKVSHTFLQTVLRGVLCDVLVSIAMWQATGAASIGSKFVAIALPNSGFAALGLEHSIANMFLGGLAIASGSPITPLEWVTRNLIPTTLGNILGGLCVAVPYNLIFGSRGSGAAKGAGGAGAAGGEPVV